jgi:hypothetical protein
MKSDDVGTTLKHPETINGNVKNLSERIKMKCQQGNTKEMSKEMSTRKYKGMSTFTLRI